MDRTHIMKCSVLRGYTEHERYRDMLRTLAAFVDFLAVLRRFQGTPRGSESTSPPEQLANRIK